ncbi:MAG: sigma-70 family RNA polymerase sigma factor [Pseudomonadota bacterium]
MTLTRADLHELYRRCGPAVRARCRAICGNEADADEALRDAFTRAWLARGRFDGRYPLAWLQTLGRSAAIDVIRRRRPWADDPRAWLDCPAPRGAEPLAALQAARLLDSFKPEDAAMLRLRHAEGWRVHEIAEHLGTSERTVRRRLERLEARARALLGPEREVCHAS